MLLLKVNGKQLLKLNIEIKTSHFWKIILKDKDLVDLGFNKVIGSDNTVSF
jgi:hypothetical protein